MKLYEYENYDDYVEAQTEANHRKLNLIWVQEHTIKQVFKNKPVATNILCHGTRNGTEQKLFKKYYPKSNIIGTEISDTATKFPNTVQHDFHERKEEWIDKFDIVYSNSWDHSYDPEKSLRAWSEQLNNTGRLYVEQGIDPLVNISRRSDPLEIYHEEIVELFKKINLKFVETFDTYGMKTNKFSCVVYIGEK